MVTVTDDDRGDWGDIVDDCDEDAPDYDRENA